MQEELRPILAALATAGAVSTAHAVTLGDLQVESALGQRLEARVRVTPAPGETVDARCFSVLSEVPQGLSAVPGLQVTLEPDGQSLRLTSRAPVQEPAAGLALRAACPGAATESVREYVMLLDPLPPGTSTVVRARRGETLESLAKAMVDRPGPRREYLVAMRAANPSLARVGDRDALEEGTPVVLPDLRPAMRKPPAPKAYAAPTPPASTPAAKADVKPAMPRPARPPSEELKRLTAGEAPTPQDTPPMPSAAAEAPAVKSAAEAPAAKPAPKASTPRAASKAAAPHAEPAVAAPRATPPAASPAPPKRAASAHCGGFQLKLSSGEVDLGPSRQVSDAQRKQLRERLLVLDADDQVAALLALRHSVQQLESRVAELQLKLATMPESFPARPAAAPAAASPAPVPATPAPAPAPAAPPPASTTPAPAPAPTPPAAAPEKAAAPAPAEPPPAPAAATPAPPASEPAPVASPPAPEAEPAPSRPSPAASETQEKRAAKPVPAPAASPAWWAHFPEWAWIAAALLGLLVLWLVLRMRRPRPASLETPETDLRFAATETAEPTSSDMDLDLDAPASAEAASGRAAVDSDAVLATRLGDSDSGNLRRRYIEERFPEVINGTIVLEDPDSVVKGARLFYEDGAMTRAVELLQFAIEDHPDRLAPWLALFEIFRLERLSGEYAELALRFQKHHGSGDPWRKVRWFGREIDPANALYREDAVNTLETIGPREGKRLAANLAPVDPIAENWLQAPMDFENEVLANELRNALMARAQLVETDLAPNPMPALRNVEMFTVA